MSRPTLRSASPAATPLPTDPERTYTVDVVQPLLDDYQAGQLLGGISAAMVEKLRECEDLPAVDLSSGDPAKRRKGLWRYDPIQLREWWRARQTGGKP